MARRIPLPRLTQRQRMSRWQRERRQQAVIVTVFSALLFFAVGLVAWAASSRYYDANLLPAASVDGAVLPMRDYQRELGYQLTQFYLDFGVPPGYENDQQVVQYKQSYETIALDALAEQRILDARARADGITVSQQQVDTRYAEEYGEYRARQILIVPVGDDKTLADQEALARARAVRDQLVQAPMDQALWNQLAKEYSGDPGSADSGGDLGFVGKGQLVAEFENAVKGMRIGDISEPTKSQFGYHVIQLLERRAPEASTFVMRQQSYGYTVADVKRHVRYLILKDEYTKRAQDVAVTSPTPQVRLAWISVASPTVSGGDFTTFSQQVKKVNDIQAALAGGADFAQVAKDNSEDAATKDTGGELGWFAKGMLPTIAIEQDVFSLAAGKVSQQRSDQSKTFWYKVLERDESRALDPDQTTKIKDNAYNLWLQQQRRDHGVKFFVPGHELDA